MRLNVVLFQPEIPQNTGNIARTCACTGAGLHLVRPLGFQLTERSIRRSGMDYFKDVPLSIWDSDEAFLAEHGDSELFFFTGRASNGYANVDYTSCETDMFLAFGRESTGIDPEILARFPERCLRIPMVEGRRSLNLSNSVAIAVYEVLRQLGFAGLR